MNFKKRFCALLLTGVMGAMLVSPTASAVQPAPRNYSAVQQLLRTFPDGSYYSKDGKACTCHKRCTYSSNCNCIKYDSSSQCMAFAKYCFYVYNDKNIPDCSGVSSSTVTLTEKNLQSYLKKIGNQAYVRGTTSSDRGHSVFITGFSETEVYIYDANYTGNCKVSCTSLSYKDFLARIKYLNYYVTKEGKLYDM